jgi:hypothetical protein
MTNYNYDFNYTSGRIGKPISNKTKLGLQMSDEIMRRGELRSFKVRYPTKVINLGGRFEVIQKRKSFILEQHEEFETNHDFLISSKVITLQQRKIRLIRFPKLPS